jgi:hypothetical protein
MGIRLTDSSLLAIAVMILTIWIAIARRKIPMESNWPLLYFIGLVVYQKLYPDVLDPYPIFMGVVCAGVIRFEFMNLRFAKFVCWVELLMFLYVIWRLLVFVLYF